MDRVDTYDVCNILFVRLVPNQELLLYSSHGRSQKTSPGQIKVVNVTKITSFWQTPLNVMGKSSGLIWEEVVYLDYQFWSLNECGRKYGRAAKRCYF